MRKFFGTVLWITVLSGVVFGQTDSLGIEKQGDKIFVVHKVLSKQTLFSLARRYKTTVTEINKANPALANGLQVGQTLKIPFGGELPTPTKKPVETTTEEIKHKVSAGETLFAIARKYEVSVTDLKTWNQLSSNALSLGQELKVLVEKTVEPEEVKPVESTTPKINNEAIEKEDLQDTASLTETNPIDTAVVEKAPDPITYEGTPFKSFEVEGVAEVIEEDEPSSKFFALHRTAKVGTVIKVKNLMNDLTVYVRVIGTIPETTLNENVIIKLNRRAYDHLKAIDKRFRVQLNYFQ